ncbi:E3 ubiquitin-protein ligase RING1 [Dendrobium catenatum]|uniref:E3 ubiquitin-protein ligase RING1 n=1 Tax=Dendrobium catenatum TaxID=906689 RepID=A0A2I0WLA0_9ASPA|nr:E3 ubiquitin-protein ligase RING1 [Dendrobium catenatum]
MSRSVPFAKSLLRRRKWPSTFLARMNSNSCPIFRYELRTDDQDYEQRKSDRNEAPTSTVEMEIAGSGGSSGTPAGSEEQNANGQRSNPMEQRFRISLPWPFRGLGSQADANSAGDAQGSASEKDETSWFKFSRLFTNVLFHNNIFNFHN